MFLVPGVSAVIAARSLMSRRARPLPVYRADQLVRAALVVVTLIDITVLTDWTSLAVRADRQLWNGRTGWLVAALACVTVAAGLAHLAARRARLVTPRPRIAGDWLGDFADEISLILTHAGGRSRYRWPRRSLPLAVTLIRARFPAIAAILSLVAGVLVTGRLAAAERVPGLGLSALESVIFAGGIFSFTMIANAWLQFVAPPGARRHSSAWIGGTAAAAALSVSLAFRDQIWAALGHASAIQTTGQLAVLTLTSSITCGAVASIAAWLISELPRRR
jgi:hypothetical protein